ncbi:GNAT family N-acetyltransferase [Neolewinella lacunae]|uniref:GNAT family N-acetyltransferase n=1 Tax=Neolewinella lacunae TaxID=1517758 RepID=A0A923PFW4_9BACT|nr:GNAT family N-acetyltransferase [Neolewinella lacunae]MBC6993383.1 GNAT family N-acetyltransferase [Neolewinella lacunae]MDN3635159.1 GNAT family N-acetyltransferase [Neolewinella lacunae]
MLSVRIRPAGPFDAAALAAIFNAYLGKATLALEPLGEVDYLAVLDDPRAALLVAEGAAGVLGYAGVKPYSPRGGYAVAGESSTFFRPGHTGTGEGERLYRALLAAAYALGYRHLTARIWATNAGSIRFHTRLGFRLVGTQHAIGRVDGQVVDVVLMELVMP